MWKEHVRTIREVKDLSENSTLFLLAAVDVKRKLNLHKVAEEAAKISGADGRKKLLQDLFPRGMPPTPARVGNQATIRKARLRRPASRSGWLAQHSFVRGIR